MLAFTREETNFNFMIAFATRSFSPDNLPFGWFDVVFVALLAFGLYRGRKNGMTKEVLPMFQAVATFLLCGLGYEIVGQVLFDRAGLSISEACILGYLALALGVFLVFALLKKSLTPKLTGSNFFGGAEYYMGMFSGLVLYLCATLCALALLHGPYYSPAEIAAQQKYNFETFGGGQQGFTGDFFPTFPSIQEAVFKKSLVGPLIDKYLGVFLIDSTHASGKPAAKPPLIHFGN
jgi:hypothetical protein